MGLITFKTGLSLQSSTGLSLQLSHLHLPQSHFPPLHLSQDFPPFTKSFTLSSFGFLCSLSLHEQEPHLQCFSSLSQRSHLWPLCSSCLSSSLLDSSSLLESSSSLHLEGYGAGEGTGEGTGVGAGVGAGAGCVTMGPHA